MNKKYAHEAIILSIPVFSGPKFELLKMVQNRLENDVKADILTIFTPNAEQMVQAQTNERFRTALTSSEVRIPDGMSLVLASRLLSLVRPTMSRITERISGVDLIEDLFMLSAKLNKSVFLMGGAEGAAFRVAQMKKDQFPVEKKDLKQKIIGTRGHASIRSYTQEENEKVLKEIADFKADILLVGYGAPSQELWVSSNKEQLREIGVKVVMVVGGAFDMLSGQIRRAPRWMRHVGLEWLWRLLLEPWRWRRQLRLFAFWQAIFKEVLFGK